MIEIPIVIENNTYSRETVSVWQNVWRTICKVAYENVYDIQSEIITGPSGLIMKEGSLVEDNREFVHTQLYNFRGPKNYYELTLDHMWKQFHGEPHIIKSLKKLHVPRILFHDIGVRQWFAYSFPCCVVTFWDE